MKHTILSIFLLVAAVATTGVLVAKAVDAPDPASTAVVSRATEDPGLDGKKIFLAEKCDLCHNVPTAGIEAKTKSDKVRGPDLVDVAKRHDDTDVLLDFLRQDAEIDGKKHKKAFKGSDEELGALVSWLLRQKSE